jgi:hypothetical protein
MGSSVTTNPACISYLIINALSVSATMTDTFTGTNGTLLSAHTADTGQTWSQTFGSVWTSTLILTGSNAITDGTGAIGVYASNFTPTTPNYTVSAPVALSATGAGWGMMLARIQSPSAGNLNAYGCLFAQGTGLQLYKLAGASPTLTQIGTTDTTFTSGTHTIGIITNGSTLTCSRDGVSSAQATGTDSTYTTAGSVGVAINQGSGSGYTVNSTFKVQ